MNCCVIGLGTFGYNVAITLINDGVSVLAIDSDIEIIQSIQDKVSQAICIKNINEESLRTVNIQDMDVVVIAIGNSFEDSVMISALLKRKFEIPMIICRSINNQHKDILELIGVNYIILPEQEAGIRLADKLSMKYKNFNRVTEEFSFVYIHPNKKWIGKKFKEISTLNSEITILGKKIEETIQKIDNDYVLRFDDLILVAGSNQNLEDIIKI